MNELTPLENQLRDWTPRRPSAKIKVRLFGEEEVALEGALAARWFAPAAACALSVLILAGVALQWPGRGASAANPGRERDLAMNNIGLNMQWNVWLKATFEWTNREVSPSSMVPLQLATTNLLILTL